MNSLKKFAAVIAVLLCAIVSASAQNKQVTGVVTGSDGEILTGATLVTGGGELCLN